jgi:hypothetical protein
MKPGERNAQVDLHDPRPRYAGPQVCSCGQLEVTGPICATTGEDRQPHAVRKLEGRGILVGDVLVILFTLHSEPICSLVQLARMWYDTSDRYVRTPTGCPTFVDLAAHCTECVSLSPL